MLGTPVPHATPDEDGALPFGLGNKDEWTLEQILSDPTWQQRRTLAQR